MSRTNSLNCLLTYSLRAIYDVKQNNVTSIGIGLRLAKWRLEVIEMNTAAILMIFTEMYTTVSVYWFSRVVSRDRAPWCHLSATAGGSHSVGPLWVDCGSKWTQSVCCVRVSLIPTSPLSAILVLASSRHSDAWVGSDVCKLEHWNEKSTLSLLYTFS